MAGRRQVTITSKVLYANPLVKSVITFQLALTLAVLGCFIAAINAEASDNSRQLDIPAFKAYL